MKLLFAVILAFATWLPMSMAHAEQAVSLNLPPQSFLLAQANTGSTPPALLQQVASGVAQAANSGYLPSSLDLKLFKSNFSIGISTDVGDFYTVGARDVYNGQWLAGWGKELFPIKYQSPQGPIEVAYIAAQNVFNADEGGKGAIGGAIGFRPTNAINTIAFAAGAAQSLLRLPPWAQQINNFTSVEFGYDYRLQNVAGVSRSVLTVGGQVRVPFDLAKGL